jgi:hypothetical protein
MEAEHPIPQEVSTYQFKLVGDMTIQQFMQVAAGAIVSLVIYSTNMAGYVKWPLIIISFLIGVAFAFFPIEDRPLSKWLVLFVKAIYSPTVYVWNKNAVKHVFFAPETDIPLIKGAVPLPQGTNQTAKLADNKPLESNTPSDELGKLEAKEQEFLNKVNKEFTSPKDQPIIKTSPTSVTANNIINSNVAKDVSVPGSQATKINNMQTAPSKPQSGDIFSSQSNVGGQVSPSATQNLQNAQAATFSPEAAPPSPPTRPNVVVGQTLDTSGKIIDGAILEIKDSVGRSVRALRTNRLGHFMIVTPLSDGKFQITTEKEGYKFEPVTITLENRVVPPIVIKGERLLTNN